MSTPGYEIGYTFMLPRTGFHWLIFRRFGPRDGHDGWLIAERRVPGLTIWTEAIKRNGRWTLEEDGRRDIVNFATEAEAEELEQYLNAFEPPLFSAASACVPDRTSR